MNPWTMPGIALLVLVGTVGAALAAEPAPTGAAAPPDAAARQKFDRRQEGTLKVGDVAPDFTVQDIDGKQSITLSALRGKPVVLVFGSCT